MYQSTSIDINLLMNKMVSIEEKANQNYLHISWNAQFRWYKCQWNSPDGYGQNSDSKPQYNTRMCESYRQFFSHYSTIIMDTIASQITNLTIVYLIGYSGADQRKHPSSASLAFVWGIHRGPVNSPHKWSVARKMFPFDDVMSHELIICLVWMPHECSSNEKTNN